jgi:uncharacterized protein
MQSINIPGENGTRIKPKYSHFSNQSPIVIIFANDISMELEGEIFRSFNQSNFNCLIMETKNQNLPEDLINATCCWDWLRTMNPDTNNCWVVGINKGSWIGMQLLMRRPEFQRFISINPPLSTTDFSFLAPCPCSGMIIEANISEKGTNCSAADVEKFISKTKSQKSIEVSYTRIEDGLINKIQKIGEEIRSYIKNNSEIKERVR